MSSRTFGYANASPRVGSVLISQIQYNPSGVEGADNLGQSNYLRKFTAEFSFEMSRSVAAMLKNWE